MGHPSIKEGGRASHDAHTSESMYGAPGLIAHAKRAGTFLRVLALFEIFELG
jgi:hypothetical protein